MTREGTMTNSNWNPWKLTTMGLLLSIVVALVTGLVVANWTGSPPEGDQRTAIRSQEPAAPARSKSAPRAIASAPAAPAQAPVVSAPAAPAPKVPTQSAIEACNQYAAADAGSHDKTMEVVKDGLIGAVGGAAIGAAGGAIAGGGKGAGTGAAIGGLVGAGGGTLYGLNENRRQDERYREAYASCMRGRGYFG
jgi:hypothetical protein